MMKLFEKLKSLPQADCFLKPEVTFEQLGQEAMKMNDLDAATALNKARKKLFDTIFSTCA